MNDVFYRIGNYNENELFLDSSINNYGQNFTTQHDYFLDKYFKIVNKLDLPIDFLISINNGIAIGGDYYIENDIRPAIVQENFVELYKITKNEKHQNIIIPIALLNEFIQSFEIPFELFLAGNYLWEKYFEIVRNKIFPNLPKRKDSIFLFDSIESCRYYINQHKNGYGDIFQVELLETKELFKADMNIYENINESITYNDLIKELFKYWNQDASESPIFEYLFQGKCKLKKI
ncbi:hypothetical protein AV926_18400 [Myroides marinus]|uniref:Uncharacterized protein n=1 Tax=Myroides marinus TaxID=703342 RepID=A0A161S3E7_9FLAO|nr:hypothetical protein [Myroides marinus]KZE73355.1 hypothetical protein AV926_18400 [Myroides marinus]